MNRFSLLLLLAVTLGCKEKQDNKLSPIVGLWMVDEVKVGKDVMTPNARWMRFNNDSTQQSGNGWKQHSVGTYNYNLNTKELTINNTNGYKDIYEPFTVSFENNIMLWKRVEDEVNVTVKLKKGKTLPKAYSDELLGVWGLEKITEAGKDVTTLYNQNQDNYLYIRWDGKFVISNSTVGKTRGIYNVHGHKPEIEIIAAINDTLKKETWSFKTTDSTLIFLNTETDTKKYYQRIYSIPN